MIRKLRLKFVLINMSIVTILLVALLGLVFFFTSANLEGASTRMLADLAVQPVGLGAPGEGGEEVRLPYFKLQLGLGGEVVSTGGGYYDLSDQAFLDRLIAQTAASPRSLGVLEEYNLRYYRLDTPANQCVVFSDISSERATLDGLFKTCVAIGCLSFFGFLWGSILLSKWAVRPVELAWQGQRQFVADASHELKTPLTVIMTNAELLEGGTDQPEEARQRFVSAILSMSRQMRTLIEQLLELARADHGEAGAAWRPVNLSKVTEDTLLPFEPIFFEGGLALESAVGRGIQVSGDEAQLGRVLEALLDNARKYARPGGRVRVTLERRGRCRCLLTVANQGDPIPPDALERLFERFYRADPARHRTGSFGLGLSIARGIVTRHRGRIWAESRAGINSFHVELPCV